jgi:hypothetical protein
MTCNRQSVLDWDCCEDAIFLTCDQRPSDDQGPCDYRQEMPRPCTFTDVGMAASAHRVTGGPKETP